MRVSTMTVYRIIKSGELPAVRVGRSFRVRDVDVDTYLGRDTHKPAEQARVVPPCLFDQRQRLLDQRQRLLDQQQRLARPVATSAAVGGSP